MRKHGTMYNIDSTFKIGMSFKGNFVDMVCTYLKTIDPSV